MTEKQYSSAKIQAKLHKEKIYEMTQELDKGLASLLLKLPLPMSYEIWQHLHKVKGDFE